MASSVFKGGFPSAHRTPRERVESSMDLRRLFAAIDADPAIAGAGVVYLDSQLCGDVARVSADLQRVAQARDFARDASVDGTVGFCAAIGA